MNQKIRIKLKSFDHNLVDKSAEKIVKTVKSTGAVVSGPVPLPTHKQIFTVNRSTFVNKKAREQFQLCTFKRILDIYSSTPKTIDALMKLELPSGVEVEIKVCSDRTSAGFPSCNPGFFERRNRGRVGSASVAPGRGTEAGQDDGNRR